MCELCAFCPRRTAPSTCCSLPQWLVDLHWCCLHQHLARSSGIWFDKFHTYSWCTSGPWSQKQGTRTAAVAASIRLIYKLQYNTTQHSTTKNFAKFRSTSAIFEKAIRVQYNTKQYSKTSESASQSLDKSRLASTSMVVVVGSSEALYLLPWILSISIFDIISILFW